MNIIICDDEKLFVDNLSARICDYLSERKIKCTITTCLDGTELIKLYAAKHFDAVFLDVSMPEIGGYEVAEEILKINKNAAIVFISSQESSVFHSYEYSPVWFVPKGNCAMFDLAMKKLIKRVENDRKNQRYVTVNIEDKIQLALDMEDVVYFKTTDHYLQFLKKNGTFSEFYRCKLSNIERQLSDHWFIRIHNRYLVNCRMIKTIEKQECILTDGYILPTSRSKIAHSKESFQNYLRNVR